MRFLVFHLVTSWLLLSATPTFFTLVKAAFLCDSGCFINSLYVNDNICDCPDCDDEANWSCESCGFCTDTCLNGVSCSGTTSAAQCNNGCMILVSRINDGVCDCSQCEDESALTCSTCSGGCPTVCGQQGICKNYCSSGCVLNVGYINDGYCDCPECDDEDNWSCESCGNCPSVCGTTSYCPGVTDSWQCSDGCRILSSRVNDGNCDCSECEDEEGITCSTCSGGCPAVCGERGICSTFTCDDGCFIPSQFSADGGWCDCQNCEDEPNWECDSCAPNGCPNTCGAFTQCFLVPTTTTPKPSTTTPKPTTTTSKPTTTTSKPTTTSTLKPETTTSKPTTTTSEPTSTIEAGFECDDGCIVNEIDFDDDWCDCTNCEDEPNWECDSCGTDGCPVTCGGYVVCFLVITTTTPKPTTTVKPTTTTPKPTTTTKMTTPKATNSTMAIDISTAAVSEAPTTTAVAGGSSSDGWSQTRTVLVALMAVFGSVSVCIVVGMYFVHTRVTKPIVDRLEANLQRIRQQRADGQMANDLRFNEQQTAVALPPKGEAHKRDSQVPMAEEFCHSPALERVDSKSAEGQITEAEGVEAHTGDFHQ